MVTSTQLQPRGGTTIRRLLILLTSGLVFLVGTSGAPAVPSGATGVTINQIKAPAINPGQKITIRPNVSTIGPVKVTKKYLSVYRASSGKRIVKNKKSAKLGAGAYRVKTTAKYKAKKARGGYSATRTSVRWQRLVIATGASWHTDIVATTFWVGEIFDPNAADGSQVESTYDTSWFANFGGCDGVVRQGICDTEARTPANGYFPTSMKPKQNPFYLDLPFDDVNDKDAFARRASVIPWAQDPGYAGHETDPNFSYMKNRWVQLTKDGRTCYGQIQDAGPGQYNDAEYVFGTANARPRNQRYGGAGMDVSPALNGCLGFADVNGDQDRVSWRFVEARDVPAGPWRNLVTTSPVIQ